MTRSIALLLLHSPVLALAQTAPRGFTWKHFPETGITVQVPEGWHSRVSAAKGAKAIQITKEKVNGKGFETGLQQHQ